MQDPEQLERYLDIVRKNDGLLAGFKYKKFSAMFLWSTLCGVVALKLLATNVQVALYAICCGTATVVAYLACQAISDRKGDDHPTT